MPRHNRRARGFRLAWFKGEHTWRHIYRVLDTVECVYIIYQDEICPETDNRHVQAYVHFLNGKLLSRVRDIFEDADVRIADKSPEVNRAYCSKVATRRVGGRARERGTLPDQGARHDIHDARRDIEAGLTNAEMFIKYGILWARYGRTLKEYRSDMVAPRNFWTKTLVIWGKTGIGKSTRCYWEANQLPGTVGYLLIPRDGRDMVWGNGCIASKTVVIEDLGCPGEINYTVLKRMLDWAPCPMPLKGSDMQWAPLNVIITSNFDPRTWYPGEEWTPDQNPLCRRLTTNGSRIIHMVHPWTVPNVDSDTDE